MNLIILGAGGFGQTVADIAQQSGLYEKIFFLDDKATSKDVIGKCTDYIKYKEYHFYPAFGNNEMRLSWIERLETEEFTVPTLIHSSAYVSPKAKLEQGCIVLPHAVINTNCKIAKGCIINCSAIIDHGCIIEEGCHICLGAIVKAENRITKFTKLEAREVVQARTFPV